MGMFDNITCERPLPEQPRPPRRRCFQTKDTPAQPTPRRLQTSSPHPTTDGHLRESYHSASAAGDALLIGCDNHASVSTLELHLICQL